MDVQARADRWFDHVEDAELHAQLQQLTAPGREADLEDAFFQDLSFGTAGLRGIIGPGTNRMNIYTVGKATQGLADYLNATSEGERPCVVIARDSRLKGEDFARRASSILACNGIKVLLFPRIEPVPALSFAVRYLQADAGICLTASHNPKDYNGYKVYGPDGCQIASQEADAISQCIRQIDEFDDVRSRPFDELEAQGLISWVGDEVLDAFLNAELSFSVAADDVRDVPLKVVYTPLNGAGLELNLALFSRIGIDDVTVVPEQRDPDGNFPTCPYPNPETREAMERGIALCEQVHPDVLIATDPDADRVGIAVEHAGEYVLLTGNEVGVLMLDFICKMHQQAGTMPEGATVVSTIVSTAMIDAVAKRYGVRVERTLTGFKYIGDIMNHLADEGHAKRFLLGFEESYGYLAATHVRDKDSVSACMTICQMAQYYKQQGMNLVEAMNALYAEHGWYQNRTVSYSYPGAQGAREMEEIMSSLHTSTVSQLGSYSVRQSIDYKPGVLGLPAADVLEYRIDEGVKLIIRPSGTEPKVKAYLFARGSTCVQAQEQLEQLEQAARELLHQA